MSHTSLKDAGRCYACPYNLSWEAEARGLVFVPARPVWQDLVLKKRSLCVLLYSLVIPLRIVIYKIYEIFEPLSFCLKVMFLIRYTYTHRERHTYTHTHRYIRTQRHTHTYTHKYTHIDTQRMNE